MTRVGLLSFAFAALFGAATAQEPWPPILSDPASVERDGGAADLILPMPCGGAMAFQRVVVPVDVSSPIDDRAFRMGQSNAETGFSDYLLSVHIRGAFVDPGDDVSYYYMARYEMNAAQVRALRGECDTPFGPRDRFAVGEISWFDAVELSRVYNEWLYANAPDSLPSDGSRRGFLRLPTEAEWEYATRGGVKVDPSVFPARRFYETGELGTYANYQAPGQGRGKLRPVGLKDPNPLGLFDLYGNAEELMLEPFRLNAIGRAHGQAGGLVTRGGSIDLEEAQIYTAQRSEYPMFSTHSGKALAGEFFGVRFVISSHVVSDARYDAIRDGWEAEAERPAVEEGDPLGTLSSLLEDEGDPRRREALSGLEFEFRVARDRAAESLAQAAQSTLLSGAAFVDTLVADTFSIAQLDRDARSAQDRTKVSSGDLRAQWMRIWINSLENRDALIDARETYLLSYRETLETLTGDIDAETRESAFETLRQELEASGQAELLTMLERFGEDLELYAEEPDMSTEDLLAIAIE